jgi:GH15 family glucan-1,4-alpha-glucosidase
VIVQFVLTGDFAGAIKCVINTVQSFIDYPKDVAYGYIETTNSSITANTHRVDLSDPENPTIDAKSEISYTLSGTTISGLPNCLATFEQDLLPVDDGILQINSDYPGTVNVLLQSPLYLDTSVSVTVP